MFKEYTKYDGLGLAELIRNKEVSTEEVLAAAIAQANAINPKLNAIIHRFDERAIQAAQKGLPQGAFHGVPFLLKDLSFVFAGEPYTMGSRGINVIPDYDSHIVQRFKASGLNCFGKTNTPEMGLIITTEPKAHGATHNPFREGYSSGGSSGGSAAAVSAGIVPLAGSGDGGGSIRFPAAWCGVFGFKPSHARTPLGPDYGESWNGAVVDHVITRTVRDSAAMLDAIHGAEEGAPYEIRPPRGTFLDAALCDPKPLHIALSKKPLIKNTLIDQSVKEGLLKTAQDLVNMGHHVEEAEPEIDTHTFWRDFMMVVAAYTAGNCEMIRKKWGRKAIARLEPATQNLAMIGRSLRAADLVLAMQGWHQVQRAMGQFFNRYDAMLCPTVPTTAVAHGILPPEQWEEWLMSSSRHLPLGRLLLKMGLVEKMAHKVLSKMAFTILANMTGLPAMSLPLHFSAEGLPIGVQIIGRMCEEESLFSLAGQLERGGFFQAAACHVK